MNSRKLAGLALLPLLLSGCKPWWESFDRFEDDPAYDWIGPYVVCENGVRQPLELKGEWFLTLEAEDSNGEYIIEIGDCTFARSYRGDADVLQLPAALGDLSQYALENGVEYLAQLTPAQEISEVNQLQFYIVAEQGQLEITEAENGGALDPGDFSLVGNFYIGYELSERDIKLTLSFSSIDGSSEIKLSRRSAD